MLIEMQIEILSICKENNVQRKMHMLEMFIYMQITFLSNTVKVQLSELQSTALIYRK